MRFCRASVSVLSLLLVVSAPTLADVLLVDSIQSAPAVNTPRNGNSMSDVRAQFGNPVTEIPAVGDPPISRWEYEGFSVFFENDLALHTVIHQAASK
jgi:hypothetical protein